MPQPPLRTDSARSIQPKNGKTAEETVYYTPLASSDHHSDAATVSRKRSKFLAKRCYAINPDKSIYMEVWDAIMIGAFIEVTVQTPYEMAFFRPKFGRVFWTNRGFDIIFLIDMVIRFFVAYPDHMSGRMVSDFRVIAHRYLTGWFAIDAISIFPWDWYALMQQAVDPTGSPAYFNPVRILRLLRISRVVRSTHGGRIMERLQVSIGMQFTLLTILQNILLMFVGCHWSACLWGWVAMKEKYQEGESKQTWLSVVSESKGGENHYSEPIEIYWISLYWAMMTMTGVGYGDVVPQNHFEFKIAVVTMALVSLIWAFVVGNIVTVLATLNPHETHYKQSMDDLNTLLTDWDVPHSLRVQLRSYFVQAKRLNQYLEQKLLMERVSPHLHAEVSIHMHRDWVKNVSFFHNLPHVEVITIVRLLTAIMYAPNEEIPAHRSLFIVWRGLCSRQGKVYLRNEIWGDDMVLDNDILRSTVSARAISFVELLMLDYVDLVELSRRSPMLAGAIRTATKFIAFTKGMLLMKRVFSELAHHDIVTIANLSQEQRLAIADLILTGRVTEDVMAHPFQVQRIEALLRRVEVEDSDSKNCDDTIEAESDSAVKCQISDGATNGAAVLPLTAVSNVDPLCEEDIKGRSSTHLKATVQSLLEELISRAHTDGLNSRTKVRGDGFSSVQSPPPPGRSFSKKVGAFGHTVRSSLSQVRGPSPFRKGHSRQHGSLNSA